MMHEIIVYTLDAGIIACLVYLCYANFKKPDVPPPASTDSTKAP